MPNSETYRFGDFTFGHYRECIHSAKATHQFISFEEAAHAERSVIWRHDVDFSMQKALRMAQIEAEENVRSTYFLLLHSEFYNLLEKENTDIVHKIKELGHHIGLHFDSHYYNISSENELNDYLSFEKSILDRTFGIDVKAFSFHITNSFTMTCEKESYAGLMNVYSRQIKDNYAYCSDSYGVWRFSRLHDFIADNKGRNIQVLTHPELWSEEAQSPKERVWACIDGRANYTKRWYDEFLKKNNREHID